MYPGAQSKASEEIDRVIGHDRLPTMADLEDLPYIEALWKETLRWSPPAPIGESPMQYFRDRFVIKIIDRNTASHN